MGNTACEKTLATLWNRFSSYRTGEALSRGILQQDALADDPIEEDEDQPQGRHGQQRSQQLPQRTIRPPRQSQVYFLTRQLYALASLKRQDATVYIV